MALTNYPNGVASFGIPVLPGLPMTTGKVFFVDSGVGSNGHSGKSPSKPFATIDYAIGLCTDDNGDVIVVMPGHAETVAGAAGIDFDVAGIRVIGLGAGRSRPTITMSAVASTIHFDATGTWLENVIIKAEHDCTILIDIDRADCVVKDVEFRSRTAATAREFVTAIDITGGAANACDRTKVIGCHFYSPTIGASRAIELGEVAYGVEIRGCQVWGDYSDAPIHNPTGKVLTQLLVADCFLENTNTGEHSIELVSACTGMLVRNMYKNDMTQQTGVDPGSCFSFESYQDDAIDTSGILTPVIT